jgi:rfaE bifunctional protein kinase chain/domain/rfaE bifunctional protein nucleotidyltransferase chain/domain
MGLNNKVRPIRELPEVLEALRLEERKIVLCHGVFDLLHIGHIRYFEAAKKHGDVLVVTVTPDHYVNKGPDRPAFGQDLRAEAIGALGCVDYVAINEWPMAVETIHLLEPDFYVKGSEYRDKDKDHTGGIRLEEEAVKSVGGALVFTDDITFSSSHLINRYQPSLPTEVREYLVGFGNKHSSEEVLGYVNRSGSLSVLVVGEAIIDDYQYCEAIGKSSKEPMLAVRQLSRETFAGGVLAVSAHLATFCERVGLVTLLGTENSHEEFIRGNLNSNIEETLLFRSDSPTIVKRRYIDKYFSTKLLEVYEMNVAAMDEADNEALCAALAEQVPKYDVVIVVDYGHGMLTNEAIEILCDKARFLAVNTQSNAGNLGCHTISTYPRADLVCIAENEARLEARDRGKDLEEIVLEIADRLNCGRVVVTRGKYGCVCYGEGEGFFEIPALADQIVDRVGAGDAFLSVAAMCLAEGAPVEVAGLIGNAAGAQAVATVGNRVPIERVGLLKHIETLLK